MEESIDEAVMELIMQQADRAVQKSIENIVMELPNGKSSSIADKLRSTRTRKDEFTIFTDTIIWVWLNDGTGVFSSEHAGAGPMGRIVPIHGAKYLHFKNAELARILGFPTEDVFLKSVKGIMPRWYWDRHFDTGKFAEVFESV